MSPPTLETLIEQGDVTGVLLLSDELRETITPRELDLIRQAFEAGLRFGRAERSGPHELDLPLAQKRIGFAVAALICWNVLLTAAIVGLTVAR